MRRLILGVLVVAGGGLIAGLAGCDRLGGPRLAMGTGGEERAAWTGLQRPSRKALVYGGKTPEQWGQMLGETDREEVLEACRALKVLGTEGRPHLIRGVSNSKPETRRLCLETLTVGDFRRQGEAGRQVLVKLSGDVADVRIRERAMAYLAQWDKAAPSQ